MVANATTSRDPMSPKSLNPGHAFDGLLEHRSRTAGHPDVVRKPVLSRVAFALALISAVSLGLLIKLIGGFRDQDSWSPYYGADMNGRP